MMFFCLIPFVVGQPLWKDMETSEDVIRRENNIPVRTTIVRPTNFHPTNPHKTFTDKWRKEGGKYTNYLTKTAEENPPNMWINRRSIAMFLLDCIIETKFDGNAVSLFQGRPNKPTQITPSEI